MDSIHSRSIFPCSYCKSVQNIYEFILFQYPDPFFSAEGDFYIQSLPRNENKDEGDFLHIAKVPATVSK